MRFVYISFLLCIWGYAYASDFGIEIRGKFSGAQGQLIRLLEYKDQVSYKESEIKAVVADSMGYFQLNFSKYEPQYVFFRIDHARMGFFVEPGQKYQIKFNPVDFTKLDDRINPNMEPWYFDFEIIKPINDLNHYINKFDSIFNDFILENFSNIHRTRNRSILYKFRNHTDTLFGHFDNPYFQNYYRYKFANFVRLSNLDRFDNLMAEYIFNQPLLYENTQFMNFFNTMFYSYGLSHGRKVTFNDLNHTVNNLNSARALMDSLGKDTMLRNELLRELVMIKTLQELHSHKDFIQGNVRNMLTDIATQSKFERHRQIAQNTINKLEHLRPNTPAPELNILSPAGHNIDLLNKFHGRWVLLEFWATWCETCKLDKIAMQELYPRYQREFEFLSISVDRDKSDFVSYLQHNTEPWHNYHIGKDFRLMDEFEVKSIPLFIIINPSGQIAKFPAPRPSENLAATLDSLLHASGIRRRNQ